MADPAVGESAMIPRRASSVTATQFVRLLRAQWMLIALVTLCGALAAAATAYLQPPTYQAGIQLFVSTSNRQLSEADLADGGTFSQQRVKSYAGLLTSSRVLAPVIQEVGLHTTTRELANHVHATNPIDTVLLQVTVDDISPTRARDVANAIAAQFPRLVAQLETPPGAVSPLRVSVTEQADTPVDPVSPHKNLYMVVGLLLGLGAGLGAALLRQSLDRTVTGRTLASEITGAPVLATIADDPEAVKTPLIAQDTFSPRAEAIRRLRTNIRFLSVDSQLSSLVVTSARPGEGKTSLASNLAIALAQNGERVVLIDADLRRPTVADMFGMPSGFGLTTVLIGEILMEDALQVWRPELPLQVLVAGPLPPNPSELIGSSRMAELIDNLVSSGATVVIDSPPLLPVTDAAILARITDGALVVVRSASTQVDQLRTAADGLRTVGASVLGVVLTHAPRGRRGTMAAYASGYTPQLKVPVPLTRPASRSGSRADHFRGGRVSQRAMPQSPPTTLRLPDHPRGDQQRPGVATDTINSHAK